MLGPVSLSVCFVLPTKQSGADLVLFWYTIGVENVSALLP